VNPSPVSQSKMGPNRGEPPARPPPDATSATPRATSRRRVRISTSTDAVQVCRLALGYEPVTCDGAPHSFFDRKQEEFADASADAWRCVLEFIERHG